MKEERFVVYFDATGAGRGPEPVAGPFDTTFEAYEWLEDFDYENDRNYFVDVYHEERD